MNIDKCILNYKFSPYLVILTCICAFFSWLFLTSEAMLDFVAEFGIVENATVAIYIIAAIFIWFPTVINKSTLATRVSSTIIVLAMAMREADLHKYINGTSMFKLSFWLGDYPIQNKIVSAIIILPIAISLLFLVLKYYKVFFKGFIARNVSAVTLMTFILTAIVSKIIDRSLDVLKDILGVSTSVFPLWLSALQNAFEEYLELLLPVLIIVFVIQYIKTCRPNEIFPVPDRK